MAATERPRLALGLFVVALACIAPARADEASGTVTGRVELRGSYYWERSTRVVAPTLGARLDMPNGISVQGHYLVDSITSASVAAGALVDVGFTEIRHEGSLGVLGEHEVGSTNLAWNASFRGSREPDYRSYAGSVGARLAWDERVNTVGLQATVLHDEVRQVFRVGNQTRPPNMMGGGTTFAEDFDGLVLAFTYERVMTRRLVLLGGYDLGRLAGYLASPYRQVQVNGLLQPESHPDLRLRHTLYGRASFALPRAHAAIHPMLRLYSDDWGIRALTLDTRYYQEIGDALLVRLRYRYYVQTASSFESGEPVPTYVGSPEYFTADPKMQAFHDHEFGLAFVTRLSFLGDGALRIFRDAEVELAFDYRLSTNRFGDGIFGAVSVRAPF